MTVTEVGLMAIKPGLNVMDESTDAAQLLKSTYTKILESPDGCNDIYYGREVVEPSYLWSFFDWNTLEDHAKFAQSTTVSHVLEDLPKIFSCGVFTKHIVFEPSPSGFSQSPVVSVVLGYFPPDILQMQKELVTLQIRHVISAVCFANEGTEGYCIGWGVENDFPIRGDSQQRVGSIFMACIGWTNEISFEKFEQSVAALDYKDTVQSLDGLIKLETFQLQCKKLG